eukprot:12705315-Ditylum_brightwellii.AAC.1
MRHHTKAKAGISKELYGHTLCYSKFGEVQGKASSPSNWLFTICALISALHGLCKGINLRSIGKKFKSQHVADAYLDNMDAATINQDTQISDPPPHNQRGQLSKEKTSWYLIWWIWANGAPHMATEEEAPTELK